MLSHNLQCFCMIACYNMGHNFILDCFILWIFWMSGFRLIGYQFSCYGFISPRLSQYKLYFLWSTLCNILYKLVKTCWYIFSAFKHYWLLFVDHSGMHKIENGLMPFFFIFLGLLRAWYVWILIIGSRSGASTEKQVS